MDPTAKSGMTAATPRHHSAVRSSVESLRQPKQLKCGTGAENDRKKTDTKYRVTEEARTQRYNPSYQGTLVTVGKSKVF